MWALWCFRRLRLFYGEVLTVFRSRGWDARLVAPPGVPRSEDRERGFWPSTVRPPSRSASSLMMRPRSSDRPRPRVGGAPPRLRRCARAFECPALVRLAAGTALLWCRHGAVSASGVQNGGDQPGHHAARHRSTLKTQRKHNESTRSSHGFLEIFRPPRL